MLTVKDLIKTQIIILKSCLTMDESMRLTRYTMIVNCQLMFKIANPFQGFERKVLNDGCMFLINELNKMLEE